MTDDDEIGIPVPRPSESDDATCWAIMGASGGVGVTSLVIETAYSVIRDRKSVQDPDPRVCILDLDFEHGAVAPYLDIQAGIRPEVLTGDASRIDTAMASALISKHACGVRVLAAPQRLGGNDAVNPQCVLALMDAVSTMYDTIILDVPRIWRPWTQAALLAADRACLVTELTIPALHRARLQIEQVEHLIKPVRPLDIILSKYERRSFRATVSSKDAEEALGRKITAHICLDADTPRDAMNCGEPAGSVHPDSRYSKDIYALTQTLFERDLPQSNTSSPRRLRRRRAG